MNKKSVTVVGFIGLLCLVCSIIVYLFKDQSKEIKSISNPSSPSTPEELLEIILFRLVKSGDFKNEQDFQSRLIQEFIKRAKDMTWVEKCPICYEEISEKLNEFGLLEEFEEKLEKKYRTGKH